MSTSCPRSMSPVIWRRMNVSETAGKLLTRMAIRMSVTSGSPERPHREPLVAQHDAARRGEIRGELLVVLQPPERRPADHDVPRPLLAQPRELADGRLAVGRRAPVASVPLDERDGAPSLDQSLAGLAEPPARVVDHD